LFVEDWNRVARRGPASTAWWGLDEDIWRRRGCQSNRLGGLHKLRKGFLRGALDLDFAVYDLDEDAPEDRPVVRLELVELGQHPL
jgi:hypothetical protein